MKELLLKIQESTKSLPNAQRLVAQYVLLNYDKIPFITISNMAKEIGVSDKTIVNFCAMLGFESFTSFKNKFTKHVQSELAIYNNFETRLNTIGENDTFSQVIDSEKSNIETTLNLYINRQNFEPFIDMLDSASNIYIYGLRTSSILVDYLSQTLRVQGYNIITNSMHEHFFDQLYTIKPNDLFIVFTFSKYIKKSIKALKYVSEKKIPSVAFTDSTLSPAFILADLSFICETKSYSFQASYIGVFSLINAIITETSLRHKKRTKKHLDELGETLDYFDIFTESNK